MKYLSVCSGIEAATVAWHPLGWTPFAFSEIDRFPSEVLAHHYGSNLPGEPLSGNAPPNLGDMTKFKDWPDAAIDVLVGGTPCQSFSVAGLRKGLADPRGNLALTYLAIADRYRPKRVVWENVPGILSSNGGRDFGAFLGGLGELGYGWAYRVLDAQYVRVDGFWRAVPQRRRRVFVVGHLGDWRRAAAVLFERESLSGHPAPRRQTREGSAGIAEDGARGGGCGAGRKADGRPTTQAFGGGQNCNATDVSTAVTAHPGGRYDLDVETFVAHTLKAEGFDASEDGTGRGIPLVPFDTTQITSAANRSVPKDGDPCHPLAAGAHAPAIAFQANASGDSHISETYGLAPTLRHAEGGGSTIPAVAYGLRNDAGREGEAKTASPDASGNVRLRDPGFNVYEGFSPTLEAGAPHAVASGWAVRRLTPTECERLQGFPDGYTAIPRGGKLAADGPRYKALGNSMAVNAMRWIGRRIEMVEALERDLVKGEAA